MDDFDYLGDAEVGGYRPCRFGDVLPALDVRPVDSNAKLGSKDRRMAWRMNDTTTEFGVCHGCGGPAVNDICGSCAWEEQK